MIIVNTNAFAKKDLEKAGYAANPLEDGSLEGYRVIEVELTRLTRTAVDGLGLDTRSADRSKNFFALGMMYWLFQRPLEPTLNWIGEKFSRDAKLAEANRRSLQAGFTFCEATEVFSESYSIPPAVTTPGTYRNIAGNSALALGLVAAAEQSGLTLFLGSYPITPASDILHELARFRHFGIITFQAEDEIAAITAAIGASFAGNLGCTSTSGPGMALKSEALGLAVMAELPLVVIDIQRGGPSTGLPTKTEQADLLQAMFGRASEAPLPVLAAATPADCFDVAYEAARLAIKYMTPIILLSDGYLGNGAEPWKLPRVEDLPAIPVHHAGLAAQRNGKPESPVPSPDAGSPAGLPPAPAAPFRPYARDPETLARPWAIPGTPGFEHRIGGLEKADGAGTVSYDPLNHEAMVHLRRDKVERMTADVPAVVVDGEPAGRLLVLGWGSTYGAITGAVRQARTAGINVSQAQLRWLNPFPTNLGEVLGRFETVLVPEMNLGQLALLLRARYLKPVVSFTKVQGRPFAEGEILERIVELTR